MSEEKDCERAASQSQPPAWKFCPTRGYASSAAKTIGGDFKTYVIAENTHGKSGSMKKNYGSWKVKRKLRAITPIDKE